MVIIRVLHNSKIRSSPSYSSPFNSLKSCPEQNTFPIDLIITTFGTFCDCEPQHTRSANATGSSESMAASIWMCGLINRRAERRDVRTAVDRLFAREAWLMVKVTMCPEVETFVRTRSVGGSGSGAGDRWV